MFTIDTKSLSSFLYFGYIPDEIAASEFLSHLQAILTTSFVCVDDEQTLIAQGTHTLKAAFEGIQAGEHVVPLSGGLDSRTILANLLDHFDAAQINTVTFGSPGTWDYDIGCMVARKIGTKHVALDLNKVKIRPDELIDFQRRFEAPVVMVEAFLYFEMFRVFGKTSHYWIGYMGDPLSGSHFYKNTASWSEAIQHFADKNKYADSKSMAHPNFDPLGVLPQNPFMDNELISYYDQCDFGLRQNSYIKPIVLPVGYSCLTPFLNPTWIGFILRVPHHYRKQRKLLRDIVTTAYPKIFALPVKSNLGLPLDASRARRQLRKYLVNHGLYSLMSGTNLHPKTNYVDVDLMFHVRQDWRKVAVESLHDLDQRGIIPWTDVGQALSKYDAGQKATREIMLLISLETYLKAHTEDVVTSC